MANPFDEAFPWKREDALAFYTALITDFPTRGEIVGLFNMAGGVEAELYVDQAPKLIWSNALRLLGRSGRILDLCQRLVEDYEDTSAAAAARALLVARPVVEQRITMDGKFIVDRVNLRTSLSQLGLDDPPFKVLIVRGEPKSGKTWSRYLFKQAADERDAEVIYLNREMVGTVTDVIRRLFDHFRARDQIPPVASLSPAWYRDVCNELIAVAASRVPQRQLWIAVDDLGLNADKTAPLMDGEIRQFFNQFVLHLPDPQTYKLFRLMLIHYPEEVPEAWELDECGVDRTVARNVTRHDIAEAVEEWRANRGETAIRPEIDRLVDSVLEFADLQSAADSKPWLQHMREELQRRLEQGGVV